MHSVSQTHTHNVPCNGQKLLRSSTAFSMLYLCQNSRPRACGEETNKESSVGLPQHSENLLKVQSFHWLETQHPDMIWDSTVVRIINYRCIFTLIGTGSIPVPTLIIKRSNLLPKLPIFDPTEWKRL